VLALVLAMYGCGSEGDVELLAEVGTAADADSLVEPDLGQPESDVTELVGKVEITALEMVFEFVTPVDLSDDSFAPPVGGAGYPCETGNDCGEGYCVQTVDGMQCTVTCVEECPFDWKCVLHTPSLPDQVYICAAPLVSLCRPCATNDECKVNGISAGEKCVVYGQDGNFCGAECAGEEDCPAGYDCTSGLDVAGGEVQQCVLAAGDCPCSQWAVDAGAGTDCYYENEWGVCPGDRQCLAAGLEACSALTPAPETCNGMDDDCDGEIDEDLGTTTCGLYDCVHTVENCVDGIPQVCDPGEGVEVEKCDGKDNDCDGQVDENFEDTDGDGVADCLVNDKDGDGVVDGLDNCPSQFNPTQADFDLDTVGDPCDPDDDNDQVADEEDCASKDGEVFPGNDETCDGKDNNCNYIVDEGNPDTDFDGWKDCVDEDDDNDGSPDGLDCAPLDPETNPAAVEVCDGADNNCNGAVDEDLPDLDGDGVADCVDEDTDGDGVPDSADNCVLVENELQEDLDQDTIGDMCDTDMDGDNIPNAVDNCPTVMNPLQEDNEGDTVGDACDPDSDNDFVDNEIDNCPLVPNEDQEDGDDDGTGDACEDDLDGDGTLNDKDCEPENAAVYPGAEEVCDGLDNNCTLGVDEGFVDSDLDGYKDCVDMDDDNDGDFDLTDCASLDPAVHAGASEKCNNIDDDCSGEVDDGLGSTSCGFGECQHSVPNCEDGLWQICNPFEGASPEQCDSLDNDCDGLVDEDLGSTTCGLGECLHTVFNCAGGVEQTCDAKEGVGVEICDAKDNDCDGFIDEEQGTTTCGLGACEHTVQNCVSGMTIYCDPDAGAAPEACDGQDNNCNGEIDEDLGEVSCGSGECFHVQSFCVGGMPSQCDPFLGVAPEQCDSLDNDCDGLVDEELGATTCGLGVCEHSVANCVDGIPQVCEPMEGVELEICDGLDNDCEGEVDPEDADGCVIYYNDSDLDGYGLSAASKCLCDADPPYSATVGGDCNDGADTVNPGAQEDCDLPGDENCDGQANEDCVYEDCATLLALKPDSVSGPYMIDPDGDGIDPAFSAYCDMDTVDGGWTLISRISAMSTTWAWAVYNGDQGTWGDPAEWSKTEMRNKAFFSAKGDEFLLRTISDTNDYVHVADCSDGQVSLGWRFQSYSWNSGCSPKRCDIVGTETSEYFPWVYDSHEYSCIGSCGAQTDTVGFKETSSIGDPGQDDSILFGWNGGDSGYHQGLGAFEDGKVPSDAHCYCNTDQDGSSCGTRFYGLFIR